MVVRSLQVGPDLEEQEEMQSKTLEALFEIYFRVLKHVTGAGLGAKQEGPAVWSQAKVGLKI